MRKDKAFRIAEYLARIVKKNFTMHVTTYSKNRWQIIVDDWLEDDIKNLLQLKDCYVFRFPYDRKTVIW